MPVPRKKSVWMSTLLGTEHVIVMCARVIMKLISDVQVVIERKTLIMMASVGLFVFIAAELRNKCSRSFNNPVLTSSSKCPTTYDVTSFALHQYKRYKQAGKHHVSSITLDDHLGDTEANFMWKVAEVANGNNYNNEDACHTLEITETPSASNKAGMLIFIITCYVIIMIGYRYNLFQNML